MYQQRPKHKSEVDFSPPRIHIFLFNESLRGHKPKERTNMTLKMTKRPLVVDCQKIGNVAKHIYIILPVMNYACFSI